MTLFSPPQVPVDVYFFNPKFHMNILKGPKIKIAMTGEKSVNRFSDFPGNYRTG
jgi:hypothetical protein